MSRKNRRQFLQTTAATGIGFWVAGGVRAGGARLAQRAKSASPASASAARARSDSADAGQHGDVVAICDVDDKHARQGRRQAASPRPSSTPTSARCSTRWARASTR